MVRRAHPHAIILARITSLNNNKANSTSRFSQFCKFYMQSGMILAKSESNSIGSLYCYSDQITSRMVEYPSDQNARRWQFQLTPNQLRQGSPKFKRPGSQQEEREKKNYKPMEMRSMTRSLLASSVWPFRCGCRTAFLRHNACVTMVLIMIVSLQQQIRCSKSVPKLPLLLLLLVILRSHLNSLNPPQQILLLLPPNLSRCRQLPSTKQTNKH